MLTIGLTAVLFGRWMSDPVTMMSAPGAASVGADRLAGVGAIVACAVSACAAAVVASPGVVIWPLVVAGPVDPATCACDGCGISMIATVRIDPESAKRATCDRIRYPLYSSIDSRRLFARISGTN